MTTVRIATFNCENLFSRPKTFGESKERADELLSYVAQLQAALRQEIFDHQVIAALEEKLAGYAIVNDLRGNHETVAGASEWLGAVELVRGTVNDTAVVNTARVISDVDADVICLIEIENRILLQEFHDRLLYSQFLLPGGQSAYPYILSIEGNDPRGIDVAVMSRLPIQWVRSHIHERIEYNGALVPTFSRDCLEVQIDLKHSAGGAVVGQPLHLLVNHLKSMGSAPANDPNCDCRRLAQAHRVAELVGAHDLGAEYVIVAGDLNSDPESPSLAPLVTHADLYNVNLELPATERGTYRTGRQQLDYLFVSSALRPHLQAVQIERRGVYTNTMWPHYPEVTGTRTQASDHAAVMADFLI